MRTLRIDIPYPSRKNKFHLYSIYDPHLGAAACDEKLLKSDIEKIKNDPNALVLLGGDGIDAIARHDPRAGQPTLAAWCRNQQDIIGTEIDYFVDLMVPIRDKIIAIIEGNHEYTPERHGERAVYFEICKRIARREGMTFKEENEAAAKIALGVEGFIHLTFKRTSQNGASADWTVDIYARHGYGGGRKPGAKINNLSDMLNTYVCDLGLSGHVHEKLYTQISRVYPGRNGKQCEERVSQGVVCGTYLRSYIPTGKNEMPRNTYGQRGAYPPRPHGCVGPITFNPNKREIVVPMSNVPGFFEE